MFARKFRVHRAVLTAAICLTLAAGARARDCGDYDEHLRLGAGRVFSTGVPFRMDRAGDLAVVVNGLDDGHGPLWDGVDVFSLADPDAPVLLSSVDVHMPRDVRLHGTVAYVLRSEYYSTPARLMVLDLSDPGAPQFLAGGIDLPGDARRLCLDADGDRILVTCAANAMLVVDVSTPTDPQLLGTATLPSTPLDVAAAWGYAFVSDEIDNLRILDLADPSAPVLVGTLPLGDSYPEVEAEGGYVYVAGDGLKIFLWQGGGQLEVRGGVPLSSYGVRVRSLELNGNLAAMCNEWGVYVEDVSVAADPQRLVDLPLSYTDALLPRCLNLDDGSCAIVLGGTDGWDIPPTEWPVSQVQVLQLGDLQDATLPWTAPVSPNAICAGATPGLYYAVGPTGFVELDISDPAAVSVLRELPLDYSEALAVDGSLACVGVDPLSSGQGFALIDLVNWEIVHQADWGYSGHVFACALRDGYAYLAAGTRGFEVYDVSDPAQPALVAHFDHFSNDVDLRGDTAFVMSRAELYAYDVSDPQAIPAPAVWEHPDAEYNFNGLGLLGGTGYMYWSGPYGATELAAVDLAQPAAPIPADSLRLVGEMQSFDARGVLGLVGGGYDPDLLYLLDLSLPLHPRIAATLRGHFDLVHVADNCLIAVGSSGGSMRLGPLPCWLTAAPDTPVLAARHLLAPHPNPFNPTVTLTLRMPSAGAGSLAIHDVNGRRVRQLLAGSLPAGERNVQWDGRDEHGAALASGVYFARFEGGGVSEAVKLVLLR